MVASEGGSASFEALDREDDFDLNSGYFTELIIFPPARAQQLAFNTEDLTVKVFGFDDGERVARKVFTLDVTQEFVTFGRKFHDIDEVTITMGGGTDAQKSAVRRLTISSSISDRVLDRSYG